MKSKRQRAYEEYLQYSQQTKEPREEFTNEVRDRVPLRQADGYDNEFVYNDDYDNQMDNYLEQVEVVGQRAKYSAKLDRFLNNGMIITGVLLLVVLAIAFLI
ncbi:hypothetical protein NHG25_07145 [Aerococcaceae bacterium NML191292]|nr:hypothetical protein [Aerococcaceae bacterium NML191292]MCW6681504.1 hypothetical protein [Aerococcaceae bacterium NML160702]